jgi:hypothetical protein
MPAGQFFFEAMTVSTLPFVDHVAAGARRLSLADRCTTITLAL